MSVRTGQIITFVFDQRGERLTGPRLVKGAGSSVHSSGFSTVCRGMSSVVIDRTFAKVLRFSGAIHFKGQAWVRSPQPTWNPFIPKLFDMEAYRDPVDEFVLWDFRLTNEPTFR